MVRNVTGAVDSVLVDTPFVPLGEEGDANSVAPDPACQNGVTAFIIQVRVGLRIANGAVRSITP